MPTRKLRLFLCHASDDTLTGTSQTRRADVIRVPQIPPVDCASTARVRRILPVGESR